MVAHLYHHQIFVSLSFLYGKYSNFRMEKLTMKETA